MSYNEKDDCNVTKAIKLDNIRKKAEQHQERAITPGSCNEAKALGEILSAKAHDDTPSANVLRNKIVEHIIETDYKDGDDCE